jgi:uncharacterized protein (DUF305 family)
MRDRNTNNPEEIQMFHNNGSSSSLTTDPLSTTSNGLALTTTPLTADPFSVSDLALRTSKSAASDVYAAGSPAPDESAARFDVRYLQETIGHHMMAIEMAELAVDRVINDDLRSLAQSIVETQTEERETMQTWLKEWYGFDYEPEMNPGEERMIKEMSIMRGAEFEVNFMQQMTMHHMAGINDAVPCTASAGHVELKGLCNDIASTQMREAEQMRQWLRDRYQTGVDMIGVSPDADTDGGIANGSFERGNFTGWSTIGHTDIQTLDYGVFPTEGAFQALITTESETVPGIDLEPLLGLEPGSLNFEGEDIEEGSALQLTFNAEAGDILTFDWNFLTDELGSDLVGSNDDFAFVVLQSSTSELADISSSLNTSRTMLMDETGYQTFSTTIDTSGTYTMSIGVVNVGDPLFDSALLVDNFKLGSASSDESTHIDDHPHTDQLAMIS